MLLSTKVPVTRPVGNSILEILLTKKKEIANMKMNMELFYEIMTFSLHFGKNK